MGRAAISAIASLLLAAVIAAPAWATDPVDRTKLGLEDYFTYESTPTGLETALHVNVATGNAVWHSIPTVNSGRGLSTVINVTYNSQDRGGYLSSLLRDDPSVTSGDVTGLLGFAYNEIGNGFSIGISGITRLNEPLAGVQGVGTTNPPTIGLTDADGTAHVFTHDSGHAGQYIAPPGVHLFLRRNDTSTDRRWVATRPDGVRFFFDEGGYPTYVVDRNGNTITFQYELYSKVTGGDCSGTPAADQLCTPHVVHVLDPAGRSLDIEYESFSALDGAGSSPPAGLVGPVGGTQHIKRIIDHANRWVDFTYDGDDLIDINRTKFGRPGPERHSSFGYTGTGADRVASTITDPMGAATTIAYEAAGGATARRATSVTNRRENETTYAYATAPTRLTATRPGSVHTVYESDSAGRVTSITEDVKPSVVRVTALQWDSANNLTHYEQAHGAADAAETVLTYDALGNIRTITDGLNRTTTLGYRYGDEFGPSPNNTGYVSDLITVLRPNDAALMRPATVTLIPDAHGNITSQQYFGKAAAITHYPAVNLGLPDYEIDEVGNKTTYSNYDDNGLPQTVVDPRGNQASPDPNTSGTWQYRYDEVGNLVSVADPRGTAGGAYDAGFSYNRYDEVTSSALPKCTDPSNTVCPVKQYSIRFTDYDDNGNPIQSTDANGHVTLRSFTAMDELASEWSPPVKHEGEPYPVSEKTVYEYDARENLSRVTTPNGEATATDGDYATSFTYDALDRVLTQTQQSRGSVVKDLVTSYAYDLRDNLVAVADPRHNEAGGDPVANAGTLAKLRWLYEYDKADNRIAETEDPGSLHLRSEMAYDANDNATDVTSPRGVAGPAVDRPKFTTHSTYDVHDDVTAITRGGARTTTYTRRDDGMITAITSPKGVADTSSNLDYVTRFDYDPNGEVKELTLPRDLDEPGGAAKVTYVRNAVGDPISITDPRGNTFTNAFYDGGELKSTTRPSWWMVELGGGMEVRERTPDEWLTYDGSGEGLPTGPGDFGSVDGQPLPDLLPHAGETSLLYDDEMELTCVTDVAGNRTVLDRDSLGRVQGLIQPFKDDKPCNTSSDGELGQDVTVQRYSYDRNGNLRVSEDARGFKTSTLYDQFDRWISQTNPGSASTAPPTNPVNGPTDLAGLSSARTTAATWDANDNLHTYTDGENRTTTDDFDAVDRLVRETDNASHVSDYGYDADGNLTCSRTPRGATTPASACAAGGFSTIREYDEFSELTKVTQQAVATDGTQNLVTDYTYDLNGNQTSVTAPGAARSPSASVQRFETTRVFDGRDRLWRVRKGVPQSGDSDSEDVSRGVYEYDPNGNLRRVIDTRALNSSGMSLYPDDGDGPATGDQARHATVYVTDADNLLTDRFLPFGFRDARDERHYRQHLDRDQRGRVSRIDAPYDPDHDTSTDHEDTSRTRYTHYANGWIASAVDEHYTGGGHTTVDSDKLSFHYDYDRQGNQTDWRIGADDSSRRVWRQYYPDGSLGRRVAYENSSDDGRQYSYGYYRDGQMAEFLDGKLDGGRRTKLGYDSAGRLHQVNETWKLDRDTKYRYDEDNNVTKRWTDGRLDSGDPDGYTGGKASTFTYDSIGRERESLVQRSGESNRATLTEYWPSGGAKKVTRPNLTIEETFYDTQGRVRRRDRTPHVTGATARVHGYFYDNVGNRIHDDRGGHEYNARDQLVKWTRKRDAGDPKDGSVVTYDVTGSGAISKRTDGAQSVTYDIKGDQIDHATVVSTSGSTTLQFGYDGATGAMTCSSAAALSGCVGGTRYDYDGFGRLESSENLADTDPNKPLPSYRYDGLDRRDWKCVHTTSGGGCGADDKDEYGYVGMTEALSSTTSTGSGPKRLYDYDSSLRRLGQDTDPASGPNTYRSYFTDPNGSVIGLEDDNGVIADGSNGSGGYTSRAIYDFDPYGDQDIGEGSLSADAKANPFRFEGFEYDSGVATYDMQARPYRPEIGRFTAPDRFEDSLGDFALQSDPLTQNRYAFGAGNPINNIEFDGHGRNCDAPPCPQVGPNPTKDQEKRANTIIDQHIRAQQRGMKPGEPGGPAGPPAPSSTGGGSSGGGTSSSGGGTSDKKKSNPPDFTSICAQVPAICSRGALLAGSRGEQKGPGLPKLGACPFDVQAVVCASGGDDDDQGNSGNGPSKGGSKKKWIPFGPLACNQQKFRRLCKSALGRLRGGKWAKLPPGARVRVPKNVADRMPDEWGPPTLTRKKGGVRWLDPKNPKANGVRIDKGDPLNPNPSQRVDHVVVRKNGAPLGRNGEPVPTGVASEALNTHIPLSEYKNWASWDSPFPNAL